MAKARKANNALVSVGDLRAHSFVQEALQDAVRVQSSLNDEHPIRVKPSYERDPDEHEFYVIAVGHAIAELLTWCEQISHASSYLAAFPNTAATKAAGITRHSHLLYHVENHLIRAHSLYDRALQLTDAVFHLLNSPAECTHKVVLCNLKVVRTAIPSKMKALRKVLASSIDARNELIHRESYKEDPLRMLEMYCVFASSTGSHEPSGPLSERAIGARIKELSRDLVKAKRAEFEEFDSELFGALLELLSALYPVYTREKKLVALRTQATVNS
jgi:Cthe_2314-like HEPN